MSGRETKQSWCRWSPASGTVSSGSCQRDFTFARAPGPSKVRRRHGYVRTGASLRKRRTRTSRLNVEVRQLLRGPMLHVYGVTTVCMWIRDGFEVYHLLLLSPSLPSGLSGLGQRRRPCQTSPTRPRLWCRGRIFKKCLKASSGTTALVKGYKLHVATRLRSSKSLDSPLPHSASLPRQTDAVLCLKATLAEENGSLDHPASKEDAELLF